MKAEGDSLLGVGLAPSAGLGPNGVPTTSSMSTRIRVSPMSGGGRRIRATPLAREDARGSAVCECGTTGCPPK